MFKPAHHFFVALNKSAKAARRGDVAAAERWQRVAERHLAIAERFQKLAPDRNPWPGR
ncbi:MAG TPA: hypothetical protein VEA63_09935 [Opitutus sp.]|nr:hypothetical protein [Opitutus sp.]